MDRPRRASPLAALILAACVEPLRPPAAAPPGEDAACLSIVAWNDLHGRLTPDDPVVDTGRVPAGGVIALADQVADVRATGDEVVLLDAGDLFTGPIESTLAEGAPVIAAYKVLGVDAAAIGNHEFDFGPVGYDRVTAAPGVGDAAGKDGPRGALIARMASAPFPFLSANARLATGAPTGWPNHRPWVRIRRGRYDVGVVGYTTQETPTTTLAPNVEDLDFAAAAVPAVRDSIRALRAAGSAPVVLLAHASLDGTLPQTLSDTAEHTGEVASLMAGLGGDLPDLVVAGHRHAWMLGRVRGVPIVSSDQHGIGLARVRFCPDGAGLELASIDQRVALAGAAPRSELGVKVAAAVAPWQERVKAEAAAYITTVPRLCAAQAAGGTRLGEQAARGMVERIGAAAAPPPGVPVVGVINAGALRAPIPAGAVRFAELFELLPFENAVAACATTRGGLLRLVNNALRRAAGRDRFPLGISGATIKARRGADGILSLASLEIDGELKGAPESAPVWLALSDFMLFGGDGLLEGVTCTTAAASSARLRDALRAVIVRDKACDGPPGSVVVE